MTRTFVSPMGDPTFANAAASLASALFPNARAQAAGRMAGAQYAGQQLANEQTGLENVGLGRSNAAYASLADVIADPVQRAVLMADNSRNANTLAGAVGKFQEQGFRGDAAARADAAGYGVNAPLFGLADAPVKLNDIDSGYQLNPFMQGGPINATGETLADIALSAARAGQAGAAANASNARAAKIADEMANPGRYRAPAGWGAVNDVSPSEAKALDDLIGMSLPGAIPDVDGGTLAPQIDTGVRNEILLRATQLYQQNGNAGVSVAQAISELAEIQAGVPGKDGFWSDAEGTAPVVKRKAGAPVPMPSAPAAPAAPPAPPAAAPAPAPAPAARPAVPRPVAKIPPSQYDAAIAEANKAIERGADPEAVRQRLLEMGVPLAEQAQ